MQENPKQPITKPFISIDPPKVEDLIGEILVK